MMTSIGRSMGLVVCFSLLALTAARSRAEPARPKSVAVLPVLAKGNADRALCAVLDDLVLSALHETAGATMRIVGRTDIDAVLGLEKTKDLLGCSDAACVVEMAGALGVDSVLAPTLGTLGKKHLLSFSWVEQQSARVIGRHSESLGTDVELFDVGVRRAIVALFGASAPAAAPASTPTAAPPPSAASPWIQLPGAAHDIGVGADGTAWVIGADAVLGGYGIYRWSGTSWERADGGAVRIDVDPAGVPWVVNNADQIYRRTPSGWQLMPGLAKDIGIGADGSVWVIGVNPVSGGFGIYRWTGSNWQPVLGGAVRIDVDADGVPWVVNVAGEIYRFTPTIWHRLPGMARDIGIGGRAVWVTGVGSAGEEERVYSWTGAAWQPADCLGTHVSVDPRGAPWVVNRAGSIVRRR